MGLTIDAGTKFGKEKRASWYNKWHRNPPTPIWRCRRCRSLEDLWRHKTITSRCP